MGRKIREVEKLLRIDLRHRLRIAGLAEEIDGARRGIAGIGPAKERHDDGADVSGDLSVKTDVVHGPPPVVFRRGNRKLQVLVALHATPTITILPPFIRQQRMGRAGERGLCMI